nr:hypothetical protein [Tanacetum cinerariifolium]
MQKAGTLTDEAIRTGSLKKNPKKRGNDGEPNRDRMRGIRTRGLGLGMLLLQLLIQVAPRMVNPVNARNPSAAPGACYECGGTDHFMGQGRGKNDNQIRGRKFLLGAKEARQDPNIMTGVFTLNDQYATTLFDSGADYSFVSITFIPLIGIEPNELGFSYEIEIATGQLSFDVILGIDWLSNHKAKIICHEKVVRIPKQDGQVLRVIRERPKEKMRHLMSAKAMKQKQKEIVVVRDFLE